MKGNSMSHIPPKRVGHAAAVWTLVLGLLLPFVLVAGTVRASRGDGVLCLENGLSRLELRE
ncbi:MAG: hypothetical protein J6W44_02120, partial [Oscillospiraceae bacterium]|nr:hypothetical protein [Oscillospiraceae bacterium]